MSEHGHQPPFYCPYCGDEDLRPFGERASEWRCGACRRVWALRYLGSAAAPTAGLDTAGSTQPTGTSTNAPRAHTHAGSASISLTGGSP